MRVVPVVALWHAVRVEREGQVGQPSADAAAGAQPPTAAREDVENLVGDWLAVPDLVEALGTSLREVRRMLQDRELVGIKVGRPTVLRVPARFVRDGRPLSALRGTFTVLGDSGLDDLEAIRWLFTADQTLPVPGAPIDALEAGHQTEIRRRAQELAF